MSGECYKCGEPAVDCQCIKWPQRLRERFSALFTERCCIECYEGWEELLNNLCKALEEYIILHNLKDCYPVQVKEKYGTLRFYMSSYTDEISSLIESAEKLSASVCEVCGKQGKLIQSSKCPKCNQDARAFL